jgi:hypothetical protein
MTSRTVTAFAVAWVLCLAALVAFHVACVMPREQALATCRNDVRARSDRFDRLTKAKSATEQERVKTREADLEHRYSDFVFGGDEMNKLNFAIQAIANKDGLQDFSARRTSTTTSLGTTKLKQIAQAEWLLSFTGDFAGMLRFMNDLERHQPVVLVNQFTIHGATTRPNALACDMECSVLFQVTGQ